MTKFSTLCRALYQPSLDKAWKDLSRDIEEITKKYASRGFPIPPGAMYHETLERYKSDISIHAQIIFNSCCQAYESSPKKPTEQEFSGEITSAIKLEQSRITATAEQQFSEFHGRFNIPSFENTLSQFKTGISSEGRRVENYFSAQAIAFCGTRLKGESNRWHQSPIGIIGISVIATIFAAMAIYLLKNYLGLAL